MENKEFEYLEIKRILNLMLENKLITKKEYEEEKEKLKIEYKPIFDLLTEDIFK